jgi:hypothetical protein
MTRRPVRILAVAIATIPLVEAMAASVLLALFGFGAGHGRHDFLIGVLGLPAIWLIPSMSLPPIVEDSDFLLIVCYPALLNFCLLWGPLDGLVYAWSIRKTRRT